MQSCSSEQPSFMADLPNTPVPFVAEHQQLHTRLLNDDPTATKELAETFLDRLIDWLAQRHPAVEREIVEEAAEDALLNLCRNPASYRPKIPLESYLRMSAQGDLRNALRDRKHDAEKMQEAVELAIYLGNHEGKGDDPLSQLQAAEERIIPSSAVTAQILDGLTEGEVRVLHLLLDRERRTAVFAEALGIAQLPAVEQQRIVKLCKDKLKKRLQRAGGNDERVP
jgi:DNA-directed RNA polymerase specialized sigma24 family protein